MQALHGARLGMAPRDVRDRFDLSKRGHWSSVAGKELSLEYDADDAANAPVRHARFEFHNGMLVAIRASLAKDDEVAAGEPLEVGRVSVASRTASNDGSVDLFIASRTCPDHREEVARILAAAHGLSR